MLKKILNFRAGSVKESGALAIANKVLLAKAKGPDTCFLNWRITVFLFFIFSWNMGQAQTVALDKVCLKHLGERANSLKVKTYATRIDEMEGGVVVLKENGGSMKGVLFFPNGKEALLMSGTSSILYLRDEQGVDQGKMSYSIDNQEFRGELLSALEQKVSTVNGRYTQDVPVVPPACFVDKWLVYHQGHLVDGENVYLYLQRIGNGDLQGTIYFAERKMTALLTGMMVGSKVDLVVIGNDGRRIGDIYGELGQDGELEGHFQTGSSDQIIHTMPMVSDGQSCFSEISKDFRYSIIYPKLNIQAFDDVMEEQAADWVKYCKKQKSLSVKKYSSILNAPAAYSYVDVHCRDEYVFSGFQIFYDPGKDKYSVKSLNFDVKKKKFLSFDDLFEDKVQLKRMVQNRARKNLGQHQLKNNKDFLAWAGQDAFENFVLQPDGVLFSSAFHPVFGQYHVLFSYPELKGYIKNKKIVKHFRKLH